LEAVAALFILWGFGREQAFVAYASLNSFLALVLIVNGGYKACQLRVSPFLIPIITLFYPCFEQQCNKFVLLAVKPLSAEESKLIFALNPIRVCRF
jgi:hypothetical protein